MQNDLIIDSFAGGGGTSLGFFMALGRSPDYAINHDPKALAMHEANHPETIHLPHNVWKVSLKEMVGNKRIGALWMSPDCRHHSRAKGGAPVSASVRDLAWVLHRWLKELSPAQRPRRIYLENVREFRDWGPVIMDVEGDTRPCPDRKGETFKLWIKELRRYGYKHIDMREIKSCVKGTPTIRNRLYLIASLDDEIVWPEDTHGEPGSIDVVSGKKSAWPTAAEIIDWERPCPSIFMSKDEAKEYRRSTGISVIRPLKENSERRIAKGVKRWVIEEKKKFIVVLNHGGEEFRGQSLDAPLATVTRARDAQGLVVPNVVSYYGEGNGGTDRSSSVQEPIATVTTGPRHALVETQVVPFATYGQQGGANRSLEEPLHTVTASIKDTNQIAVAYVKRDFGRSVGSTPHEPVGAIMAGGGGKTGVVSAFVAQHNGGPREPNSRSAKEPLSSITTRATQQQVVAAHLLSLKGSSRRAGPVDVPLGTVCAGGNHAAVVTLPLITAYYSTGGQTASIDSPMLAVPTRDRFGLTETDAAPEPLTEEQLASAKRVASFLRKYGCWDGGDIVTIDVGEQAYVLIDIGMRMFTPRELARAQGFPDDYILAAPYEGKPLTETDQRHKIGNSVCPQVAAALIAANSPELILHQNAAE